MVLNIQSIKGTAIAAVALTAGLGAGVAQATFVAYDNEADFLAALSGPATEHNFDAAPTGTITPGAIIDGIEFTSSSLSTTPLAVTNDPTPIHSGSRQIGVGLNGQLVEFDTITIGFDGGPVGAFGLYYVTATAADLDDVFSITINGVDEFLNNPVSTDLGSGTSAYFLGVVDNSGVSSISSVVISANDSQDAVEYNLDSFRTGTGTPVPAPASLALLVAGLGLAGFMRKAR